MSSLKQVLEAIEPHGHIAQFYKVDDRVLERNVGRFLSDGLHRGEGLLVIATPAHFEAFARQMKTMGENPETALLTRDLVFVDAEKALADVMVNGHPDWARFQSVVKSAMALVRPRDGHKPV